MDTVNCYTIEELEEKFPSGYDRAYREFVEDESENIPWVDETLDSLKKTFETAGVNLKDYSLGLSGSWVKFSIPTYWSELAEVDELVDNYTGQRAVKWLKDAFDIHSIKLVHYKDDKGNNKNRYDLYNKGGTNWEGFTGYCADYDFVESLFMAIHDGYCLEDAFRWLADEYEKIISNELEYATSEGNFKEMCEINGWKFLEDGRIV